MKMLAPNGPRIVELRRQKGISQADCKIDAKTLRKIERGELVREQTLRTLADDVLHVPLEAIVRADEVAGVRELDAFRVLWRQDGPADDIIITDRQAHSRDSVIKTLSPVDETFIDVIRAAEVLKWHVDLSRPSDEKIQYLQEVADLADYLREFSKGVGGFVGVLQNERVRDNKESDHLLSRALNTQKKILELHRLVSSAPEFDIKFLWIRYTFWGLECDFRGGHDPVEQNVRLIVATDTDRQAVDALIYTGTSPYTDDPDTKGDVTHKEGDA
jgi:transcriptional regulator with XRE-family HTH domain